MTSAESTRIVEGVRRGDESAECELFQQCWKWRSRRGIDTATSEDLAVEWYSKCLVSIRSGELRDVESLGAYICTVRRNVICQHFRLAVNVVKTVPVKPQTVVTHQTPESEAAQSERMAASKRALSTLEPIDREIVLRWCAGQKLREIADQLNLAPENVKTRKFRAEAKLRKLCGVQPS